MDSAKRAKVEAAGFTVADDASEFLNLSPVELRAVELLADPEFVAFCKVWRDDEDRHCPAPLVDWLIDRGYELEAEATRWAVGAKSLHEIFEETSPFRNAAPIYSDNDEYWMVLSINNRRRISCQMPFTHKLGCFHFQFELCIAIYLTHFDCELAARYPHG